MHCNKKRGAQKNLILIEWAQQRTFMSVHFLLSFFSKESDNKIRKLFPIYLKQYTFDILDN